MGDTVPGQVAYVVDAPISGPPLPSPSNTVYSENQGVEQLFPHPHQVGSEPGGAKPSPPCTGVCNFDTKLGEGECSPIKDLILTSHDQSTIYEDCHFSGEGQSQRVTPSSSRHCMLPVPVASGDVPEVQGDHPVCSTSCPL